MKTYSPKKTDLKREWYLVDVKGKTLGRVATKLANILRGKNKPIFAPHIDCGDFLVVINAAHIKLTGNKLQQKEYHSHSQYAGGLKTIRAEELLEKKPTMILEHAVAGMIPRNKLKKDILKKMKVFAEAEHKHEAQNPKPLEI
jgi:large subunit ribosomal protein L13